MTSPEDFGQHGYMTISFEDNDLRISNEGKTSDEMNFILNKLSHKYEGRLTVATLYDGGCQLIFKEGMSPTASEIETLLKE